MAAAALPWKEILKGATLVVSLARDLIKQPSSQPKQAGGTPSDPRSQLVGLAKRVEALEISGDEHAKVMKLLAEEVQSIARRAMVGYWIGVGAFAVALVSLVISLVR